MSMNQEILFDMDIKTSELETDAESISQILKALRDDIERCSKRIEKTINTLAAKVHTITGEIGSATAALKEYTAAINDMLKSQLDAENKVQTSGDLENSLLESSSLFAGILSGIATVVGFVIQNIGVLKSVMQSVASTVLAVATKIPGWVGIACASIAAVATLVTVYWDEISACGSLGRGTRLWRRCPVWRLGFMRRSFSR